MLILIRGLPGSGKTTLAKNLVEEFGFKHYEADMFFTDEHGRYARIEGKQSDAHAWCINKVREALKDGHHVVVSNTFIKLWELKPYIAMSEEMGIKIHTVEASGQFKNIHNVPEDVIRRMAANFER